MTFCKILSEKNRDLKTFFFYNPKYFDSYLTKLILSSIEPPK